MAYRSLVRYGSSVKEKIYKKSLTVLGIEYGRTKFELYTDASYCPKKKEFFVGAYLESCGKPLCARLGPSSYEDIHHSELNAALIGHELVRDFEETHGILVHWLTHKSDHYKNVQRINKIHSIKDDSNTVKDLCESIWKLKRFFMEPSVHISSDENPAHHLAKIARNYTKIVDFDESGLKRISLFQRKANSHAADASHSALLEPKALIQLDTNDKEGIGRQNASKVNTAASVISDMVKIIQPEGLPVEWTKDIIGIVAMLGTVSDTSLSRIFAKYMGEDNMLAVVCNSYAMASAMEQYQGNGRVDQSCGFHRIASEPGKAIVICLEEISPYTGKIENLDPQRRLELPMPFLPTGEVPPGFLGYAVNLIDLDVQCIDTRTTRGHGLRETLFYLLFGELQVYDTRESMKEASSCIKHGAVSLDGGIMKGNEVLSLGIREPEIHFQVEASKVQSSYLQKH